jgi:hypothetical protein
MRGWGRFFGKPRSLTPRRYRANSSGAGKIKGLHNATFQKPKPDVG